MDKYDKTAVTLSLPSNVVGKISWKGSDDVAVDFRERSKIICSDLLLQWMLTFQC